MMGSYFEPLDQNVPRIAAVKCELPIETPAFTIVATCGSGMQGHLLHNLRRGLKFFHPQDSGGNNSIYRNGYAARPPRAPILSISSERIWSTLPFHA